MLVSSTRTIACPSFLDVALLNSSLFDWPSKGVYYHFILGVAGVTLTLTAAFEFQHKNVKNIASGTLDEHATVTYNEMIEHAFYQFLNLVQVLYFHSVATEQSIQYRYLLLFLVTAPWLMRSYFPVNSFSANYKQIDERSSSLIRTMYRIKKFQYIFYKHFMLHGLNISVALYGIQLTNNKNFRWYWLILNTSYVMEFFLQTLVKKKYMTQSTMLFMQWLLMIAASVKAMNVLHNVEFRIALASMILNIGTKFRKYDLMNTMLIALLAYLGTQYPGFGIYQDAVIAVGIGITVYHLVEIKMSSYTCTV